MAQTSPSWTYHDRSTTRSSTCTTVASIASSIYTASTLPEHDAATNSDVSSPSPESPPAVLPRQHQQQQQHRVQFHPPPEQYACPPPPPVLFEHPVFGLQPIHLLRPPPFIMPPAREAPPSRGLVYVEPPVVSAAEHTHNWLKTARHATGKTQRAAMSSKQKAEAKAAAAAVKDTANASNGQAANSYRLLADQLSQKLSEDDIGFVVSFARQHPIPQLLDALPESLPLLGVLSEASVGSDVDLLPADEVLMRLVKWLATSQVPDVHKHVYEKHLATLACNLRGAHAHLFAALHEHKSRIEKCLEGMGLQGLIHHGNNEMVFLCDAVRNEMGEHVGRVKGLHQQVIKISSDPKNATAKFNTDKNNEAAMVTSHQRLMSISEHDMRNRLQRNETLASLVCTALYNQKLQSIERIIHKRVINDSATLSEFMAVKAWFTHEDEHPVVSRVLLRVLMGCEHVLQVSCTRAALSQSPPTTNDDSGVGDDDNHSGEESGSARLTAGGPAAAAGSSALQHQSSALLTVATTSSRPNRRYTPRSQQQQQPNRQQQNRSSELDLAIGLQQPAAQLEALDLMSMSNGQQRVSRHSDALLRLREPYRNRHRSCDPANASPSGSSNNSQYSTGENDVRAECMRSYVAHDYKNTNTIPLPDYPCGGEGGSSEDEDHIVSPVVEHFNRLFHHERGDVLRQLDKLQELHGHEELQMKILFTVMVLSYRSVMSVVKERQSLVCEALQLNPVTTDANDASVEQLRTAVYHVLLSQAKKQYGMSNAKQVTAQIWRALYDFPSLKTCVRFNRYILDCVNIAWHLVCGIDGRPPRYTLEFECGEFVTDRHCRYQGSAANSKRIQRFIWPGLADTFRKHTVAKAIVLT